MTDQRNSNEQTKHCIIVVGMHRSGTSVIANILRALGVYFGDTLIAPWDDNPKGYGEDAELVEINKTFLQQLGCDSDGIADAIPVTWPAHQSVSAFKSAIKDKIIRTFLNSEYKVFGFKDPRISLFLPVYLQVLDELNVSVRIIVAERPVAEIARSLEKRGGTYVLEAVRATQDYMRNISLAADGRETLYVKYQSVIHNPHRSVQRIAQFLTDIYTPTAGELRAAEQVIDPSLQHHNVSTYQFIENIVRERNALSAENEKIKQEASNQQVVTASLQEVQQHVQAIHKKMSGIGEQHQATQEHVASLQESNEALLQQMNSLRDTLIVRERLLQKLEQEKEVIEQLRQKEKRMSDKRHQELQDELFQKQQAIQDEQAVQKKLSEQMQDIIKVMDATKQELQELHVHSAYQKRIITERDQQISQLHTSLIAIERSFTWKAVRAWDMLLNKILPKGFFIRDWYDALIRANQRFINGWLPGRLVHEFKKREVKVDAGYFWQTFKKRHPQTDVLFVGNNETRTGAPRMVFDVAADIAHRRQVAMLSLTRGAMSEEFRSTFGAVIYPDELYPTYTPEEKVRAVLEHVQPKLVYANSQETYLYAKVARDMGIPSIFHIHELEIAIKSFFSPKQRKELKNYADMFIAVSQPCYDYLVHKLAVPPEQIELINSFISAERIQRLVTDIRPQNAAEEIGKNADELLVMGLGYFIYRKGADYFMHIAKQLRDKGLPVRFVWIGGRPFKEPFMEDFSAYKEHFTLLGEKKNPFPYLQLADIFVLPSREDPFPLVVLEAMSLGKPIVFFKDAGGIQQAVRDAGVAVDELSAEAFADALEQVLIDAQLRKRLADQAANNQKDFDSTALLPKFDAIISRMLSDE